MKYVMTNGKRLRTWPSVYSRFRRWKIAGIWDKILEHVSTEPDWKAS